MDECKSVYYPTEANCLQEPKGMINVQLEDHQDEKLQKSSQKYKLRNILSYLLLTCLICILCSMIFLNDTFTVSYVIPISQENQIKATHPVYLNNNRLIDTINRYFSKNFTNLKRKREIRDTITTTEYSSSSTTTDSTINTQQTVTNENQATLETSTTETSGSTQESTLKLSKTEPFDSGQVTEESTKTATTERQTSGIHLTQATTSLDQTISPKDVGSSTPIESTTGITNLPSTLKLSKVEPLDSSGPVTEILETTKTATTERQSSGIHLKQATTSLDQTTSISLKEIFNDAESSTTIESTTGTLKLSKTEPLDSSGKLTEISETPTTERQSFAIHLKQSTTSFDQITTISLKEIFNDVESTTVTTNLPSTLNNTSAVTELQPQTSTNPITTLKYLEESTTTDKVADIVQKTFEFESDEVRNRANKFGLDEKLHTNQEQIGNNMVHCPSFSSPSILTAIQQTGAYPYVYNPYAGLDYSKLISTPTNPYILQQYPYGSIPMAFSYPQIAKPTSNTQFIPINGNMATASSIPVQAFGPGGQYYVCNPVPALMSEEVPSTSIRLQEKSENFGKDEEIIQQQTPNNCPQGESMCKDNSKCIKSHQICDGDVQCKDASDEAFCTCKSRILSSRQCDGYTDCPDGEDEQDCFGCSEETFSCDDWSPNDKSATCIPIEQRCDGISQCSTGKDEEDCSILTELFTLEQPFTVSQTSGFLFRNFKGIWYPACSNAEIWANDVCQLESGPNMISPLTHLASIKNPYKGKYISVSLGKMTLVDSCVDGAAVFVQCPPLVCGMRLKIRNPFRLEEVDVSVEEFFSNSRLPTASEKTDSIVGISRVVGGKPSQPGAWPWVVSVYRNGVFHCGGVLINENWIVTAAHCIDKYWHYHYEVLAGILRRFSFTPMEQNRIVSHVVGHQLYDRANLKNDLALMRLSSSLKFNRYIRPICLPSEITAGPNFAWGPVPGTTCIVVGWGAMKEHGSDPDHLREVEVPVEARCKYREDEEGNEICAGLREGGKDACQGDSGGPFMCRNPNNPNQWYLAGIVSHGEGCARPNEPGVYTRVSMYLNWIFDHMRDDILPRRRPLKKCPGYVCKDTNRCISNKRRCDRIVDCLRGDDEINCEHNNFADIFKHAMRNFYFRNAQNESDENSTESCIGCRLPEEGMQMVQVGSTQSHFLCKTIHQLISFEKRCDRKVDCEDGSDEKYCLCTEYLTNSNAEAICDGVTDCEDYSDEYGCHECLDDQYYCRLSKRCISLRKRCNGVSDCDSAEDEWDCFSLTNSHSVQLNGDFRPRLNNAGIVTFNQNGSWYTVCSNWSDLVAPIASGICVYLGYEDYDTFHAIPLNNTNSTMTRSQFREPVKTPENCTALLVRCLNKVTSENAILQNEKVTNLEDFHITPWNAAIFIDGEFKCTGAVLDFLWIVASTNCVSNTLKLDINYISILVGVGRAHLNVVGPHEQFIEVVEVLHVDNTDIALLRLERPVEYSRYVHSLHFKKRHDQQYDESCIATGHDFTNIMRLVFLKSMSNCTRGRKCFQRVVTPDINCTNVEYVEKWSGIITCKGRNGWYPTAVFNESRGVCGFSGNMSYTSLSDSENLIRNLMQQAPLRVHPPPCNGLRCNLGRCVEPHKVCDGIPDCRNGMDELDEFCLQRKRDCHHSVDCVCLNSELKCTNGQCVPKTSFCDKINDCGDNSDEPQECNCRSYLLLTNSSKICDGIIHCEDRSDEDPIKCGCNSNNFHCGDSNYCVSNEMVCDSVKDCPNNEDEMFCLSENTSGSVPQIMKRTAGIWHEGCFSKHLRISQLEKICSDVGYFGESSNRVFLGTNDTALRPTYNKFTTIGINRDKPNGVVFKMRIDDSPLISFKEDSTCYKLFLLCI